MSHLPLPWHSRKSASFRHQNESELASSYSLGVVYLGEILGIRESQSGEFVSKSSVTPCAPLVHISECARTALHGTAITTKLRVQSAAELTRLTDEAGVFATSKPTFP
jgi:hypothetical protein